MKDLTGIYKITNPKGKVYIGQSHNLKNRQRHYRTLKCKNQTLLYNSLVYYRWDNHIFEILQNLPSDIDQDTLNKFEHIYYTQYKDCGFQMLNIRETGSNGKLSSETKQKIRNSNLGKKQSEETKIKRAIANTGQKRDEIARRNMSNSKKGKKFSESHILNMSKPQERVNCPNCNKIGGLKAMKRYHFNHCKNIKNASKID